MDINLIMKNTLMGVGVLGCLLALQMYDTINNQLISYKYKPDFSKVYLTGTLSIALMILAQLIGTF